jgi:hypothetical protein
VVVANTEQKRACVPTLFRLCVIKIQVAFAIAWSHRKLHEAVAQDGTLFVGTTLLIADHDE